MKNERTINRNSVDKVHGFLLLITIALFIWSAIDPLDRQSWFLLSLPAVILVLVLVFIYPHFRFSTFVTIILCIHVMILLVGAKYTYTANPLFNWLCEIFDLQRNGFDRVGHFMQGFTPALMAKEVFLRKEKMMRNKMFFYYILSVSMGVSALYELLEYSVSFMTNIPGETILGLQGDIFDTHKDMLMALIGASFAMFVFGSFHDRQIDKIDSHH